MKKLLQWSVVFALIMSMLGPIAAYAVPLSPALDIIAAQIPMVKTGNGYAGVHFTKEDFVKASGLSSVEEITIRSLPHPSAGVLYYGSDFLPAEIIPDFQERILKI